MKKVSIISAIVMLLIFSLIVPASAATTYQNFVLDQDGGDPHCFKDGNWFYLYHPIGQRVICYKSKDLVNWTLVGRVFDNIGDAYGGHVAEGVWGPEVHKVDGKYYMYYVSVMSGGADPNGTGNKDICVVEGTSPTDFGAYTTKKVLLDGDYAFLDPTLFQASNGNLFLFFKYRGASGTGSEIKGRPMDTPKIFGGDGKVLLRSEDMPASWGEGQMEHPNVVEKNGHYILFWSYGEGSSIGPDGYKVVYAKSSSPLGTYTIGPGNPLMYTGENPGVRAPGATSIVKDGDGINWMVYRQKKDSTAERDLVVCIDRAYLHNDGTVNIDATRNTTQTAPVPLP